MHNCTYKKETNRYRKLVVTKGKGQIRGTRLQMQVTTYKINNMNLLCGHRGIHYLVITYNGI